MSLKFWDPDQFDMIVGVAIMSGYAEGSGIEFEEDGPRFVLVKGANGLITRSKVLARSASFTIHLQNTSASNDILSGLHITDVLAPGGAGVVPITLRDKNGSTVIAAPQGWVEGLPKLTLADKAQDTPWKIVIVDYVPFIGGT